MTRPLKIGFSSCLFPEDSERAIFKGKALYYMEKSMGQWLMQNGALVYLVPPALEESQLQLYVNDLDGVLFTGGTDVSPKSYGEMPLKAEWSGDYERDQYEIALFHACRQQHLPVFGVCRGIQLINVALGGSLYQDINTQVKDSFVHRDWDIYDQNSHEVDLVEGSSLSQIYGSQLRGKVNSVHHQSIKTLGTGLEVEAISVDDGIIEAVRIPQKSETDPYVAAVQWHPEFQSPQDTTLLSREVLAKDFLGACWQQRKG